MSAAFPGIPPAPPPPEPQLATGVILHREGPDGREVLLVRRGAERRFAGGFHAFPGGKLDPEDYAVQVAGAPDADAAALVACATRELFEETGILVAEGAALLAPEARAAGRRALLEGRAAWSEVLAANAQLLVLARKQRRRR